MTKRDFLKLVLGSVSAFSMGPVQAETKEPARNAMAVDGIAFSWRHEQHCLFCHFTAPTTGWLAVGFNDRRDLAGTRFLMAVPSDPTARPEEHLATPPTHHPVAEHGLQPVIRDIKITNQQGLATLALSFPHIIRQPRLLHLDPGARAFLMLAWSRAADYGHHSAWRRHFSITL